MRAGTAEWADASPHSAPSPQASKRYDDVAKAVTGGEAIPIEDAEDKLLGRLPKAQLDSLQARCGKQWKSQSREHAVSNEQRP